MLKKAVIVPDSFKGTMPSERVCALMAGCIRRFYPSCELRLIPVADGGEGSVDAFLSAAGGEKVYTGVTGPWFERCPGFYGLTDGGGTAVIEMAAAAGLPMAGERRDPSRTTTYGVGELISDAVRRGAKRIILGLGGSATNDGGCGAAAALGVRFYNAAGQSFIPTGGTLSDIVRIDLSGRSPALDGVELAAMCDIDNPMYGPQGAAYVFAPQKGAGPEMVRELDAGLRHLAALLERDTGKRVADVPGAGAAGAMGAGMLAFFNAELKPGIEAVLDAAGFDEAIRDADVVFTGEGRLDSQSLRGKVVMGVARRAAKQNKPVIAVAGGADYGVEAVYAGGVTAVFPTARLPQPFDELKPHCEENLTFTMENILRLLRTFGV